ncbi:MerR family DNA-binding transcriptional regulator [Shimazuella kribbensis]|uniref:MerR family DNA-binding transcriptional regulator n=1 Tax=Shimazuella kribbensis TaxID=139808 RepID=UPI0003F6C45F|nr:MerR family DNA-binding transcriptional regulator [Shimazuella kribbensis]
MYYKPIEIAKALGVSTSALRHYESWGIIPKPERAENGYRKYTEVHFAYFRFIRATFPAIGMDVISKVLNSVQQKDIDSAFWLIHEIQAKLNEEKQIAEKTFAILQTPDLFQKMDLNGLKNQKLTIGQVAELAHVAPSAIRHWEKRGLIEPLRDEENGYRLYTRTHLRQILLISTLRNNVYLLEPIKKIVHSLDDHNFKHAKKATEEAMNKLNHQSRAIMKGIYELYRLCQITGLITDNNYNPM